MRNLTNASILLLISVFLTVAFGGITAAGTIYVDGDATPGGNGRSWLTAFKHLQDALVVAAIGDEVWVAKGNYKPDRGGGKIPGDREATFQLKNGVAIKGGYAGFREPYPNARDIEVYETILSGDLLCNDGLDFTNNGENSYHVVTGSGTDKTAVMDGFTITAGNAGENQNVQRGWGGGMYNNYGSPTVTNCTFSGNWSGWDGGGMHNRDSSTPTVTNCTFVKNSAKYAGGMYNSWNSNSTITNCTFSGNSAVNYGGGMCNWYSSPTLIDCTFSGNSASSLGGGMFNNSEISTLLTNCTFIDNLSSQYGGGIYNGTIEQDYSELTLMNCTFKENWAAVNGGAIDNSGNTASTMVNCLFTRNSAGQLGGGINSWINSRQTLTNCTFSGNSAGSSGGGVYINQSSPTLTNCILWGDTPQEIYVYDGTGTPVITYSNVQGDWPGIGNIYADPLFVNPAIGDYHLLSGSPCIDEGKNSAVPPSVVTDLDGNYRIANGTVDMGVYEFGSTPPPSTLFVDARATGASNGTSWVDAFTDVQEALTFATAVTKVKGILVAQGAYSPQGPLPDIRQASNPNPADGSYGVSTDADLSWTAGLGAASHDVYFGTTSPPPFVCNQTSTTFDPGTMAFCTNYYWRIDEVNDSVITIGDTWSFATIMSPPPLGSGSEDESIKPAADRSATFQLKNGVVIKGGYAGFGRPDPNARDIKLYKTILSGDIGILGDNSDNSYHVVTGTGCDETAVLDGFTITAGNANDEYPSPHSSGGGVYNYFGSPTLKNCAFSGNSASRDGGGMFNSEQSNPTLTNCTFTGNSTIYDGGAMCNRTSSPTLTNCTFSGNSANHGAGISNWPGSPVLTACTFSGNSAELGGAVFNWESNPTLTNCIFSDNSAREWGGAICNLSNSSPTLVNSTFNGNRAGDRGNGMNNRGNSCPMVTNCIFWDGGDEIYNTGDSTTEITYSDVQGGWPGQGNIDVDPCLVHPVYLEPIAYWKLDEAGGTTAYDSVGQNHGTVYGAQWSTGQVGGALDFDGVDDYVGIPWVENLANVADNFTILLWAQPLSTHQIDPESNSGTSGTNGQKYAISARQGDYFWGCGHAGAGISIGTNGISVYEHAAEYMPAVLVWSGSVSGFTHVAVVYSHKQPHLYIDGESKKTGLQSSKIVHILSNIGGHRYGYFNGLIDDVRIYDRALSADEIQQHYLIGLSGKSYLDVNMPDFHLLPGSPCINIGDPDYIAEPNEIDLDGKPRVIGGRIDMGAYEFNHIPVADAGPEQTVEAQAPWGATVTLDGTDSCDADCTPGTFDDINDFNWYEADPCDPNNDIFLGGGVILDCNLPIGEHVIILEVIDRAGASDTNEVTIIVQDTTPPDINCPPDVILECPADTSSSATGKATATDTCGDVSIRCRNRIIPGCGNTETIERTWIATDEYGNSSSCVQTITVVDTTPPVITCPADVTLECPADTSVEANGSATASDTCGSVAITHSDQWQPGCGNTGILTRKWTATDECGNSSSCMQVITVVDMTPPDFELSVSPTMLWPPDHKMYQITPSWTVSDDCVPSPDVSLVGIVANEGDNTIGDGHTTDDIQINEDGSIYLRSERSGTGADRIYTVTYQAVDDCGNITVRSATVSIPHDFKVLARIASRWLWSGPAGRIPEDLNGDGFVNLADVARFAGNWTK